MPDAIDHTELWEDQASALRRLDNGEHAWEWVEEQIEQALRAAFYQGRSGAVTANCDEPAFTVYGRDQFAQSAVVHWLGRAMVANVPEPKIKSARQRLEEIINFQSDNPDRVKVPD